MEPSNRLRGLREARDLSKQALGAIMRPEKPLHPRTIHRWEIGESGIPDEYKAKLADFFGVSIAHLMKWDDDDDDNGDDRRLRVVA